jgi:lysyl-tRNA synthetase class 2
MANPPEGQDENQIIAERRARLAELRRPAYVPTIPHATTPLLICTRRGAISQRRAEPKNIGVRCRRVMLKRVMGKASFATLQDTSGRIQLYVTRDGLGEAAYEAFKHFDLGDIVGAKGTLFKTKTGELSVKVTELRLLVKSLRPLPEKFHGLADQEQKYRQRYVDLIMSEETRNVFRVRSRIVQAVREFMTGKGFLEVETPMMQPIPGGANARPFRTYHNALDMDLYLRVAPELYLKRLVVGGFEKVFEINRNFRNEGISTRHNPEFTMLEFYEAYRDYRYLMDFTEEMLRALAKSVLGATTQRCALRYGEHTIELGKPFDRLSIPQALRKFAPEISERDLGSREALIATLKKRGVEPHAKAELCTLQLALFEATAEQQLIQPTFIVDYPAEASPLARRNDKNPEVTDRFELYIAGREIANGFSELNDPEDQAARFEEQAKAKAGGDEESMTTTPTTWGAQAGATDPGEGLGIGRPVMLFAQPQHSRRPAIPSSPARKLKPGIGVMSLGGDRSRQCIKM